MKKSAFIISLICLALTLLPSFFVYAGKISLESSKTLMLIGTIGWFLTAPYWMNQKEDKEEVEIKKTHIKI